MYEVGLLDFGFDGNLNRVCPCLPGGPNTDYRKLDRIELMQFTGLHDKNGKEIYEGDVVKNEKGDKGVVKFGRYEIELHICQNGCCVDDKPQQGFYFEDDSEYQMSLFNRELIVLGNVHENPELMK